MFPRIHTCGAGPHEGVNTAARDATSGESGMRRDADETLKDDYNVRFVCAKREISRL